MHFDAWHFYLGALYFKPALHFLRIEDLTLLHKRQNERLRHSVSPALLALPLLPTISGFNFLSVACTYQTAHNAPLIFVSVAGKTLQQNRTLSHHRSSQTFTANIAKWHCPTSPVTSTLYTPQLSPLQEKCRMAVLACKIKRMQHHHDKNRDVMRKLQVASLSGLSR
ncbi:hypothetical protein [Pseudomonas sp. DSP3-2-2]|uniref:hypothetical protein n=1 Tax=unclassified Pseudomonas TaxID=196821 RepID=UPI003CE8B2A4